MALSIKNPRTERLAREVAMEARETLTEAITVALDERLARLRGRRSVDSERDALEAICEQLRSVPDQDPRTPDEVLGYDEHGLP